MDKEIIIQEYSEVYKDEIIKLILSIQQIEFNIQINKEDQPDLSNITNYYQKSKGNFWVALCNNHVVGTISLLDIGSNQAALRKMFVHADYRGSVYRTAQKLLNKLLNWAAENKIEEIYLGTTEKFVAAHKFYEKNGFIKIPIGKLPKKFPVMKVDTKFYQYNI